MKLQKDSLEPISNIMSFNQPFYKSKPIKINFSSDGIKYCTKQIFFV